MKISNSSYNKPSFKGVNLVQISKKAFEHPDDYLDCAGHALTLIDKHVVKQSRFKYYLSKLLTSFDINIDKYFIQTEMPSYTTSKLILDKLNPNYSLQWLKTNTGTNIVTEPIKKDFLSLFILTGKENKQTGGAIAPKEFINVCNTAYDKFPRQKDKQKLYIETKSSELLDNIFNKIINNSKVNIIELNNLDEIINLENKLI